MPGTRTTTTGFHGASGGPTSSTIVTSADGLEVREVQIPAGDRSIPAYVASPARPGPHPVVLVVHEIFGLHAHIQDIARRLAHLGCLVVAPDFFVRQGDLGATADLAAVRAIVARVPDAQVMGDLDAAVAWATAQPGASSRPPAVLGFCWGGRIVWLHAAHNPALSCGVAFYGRLDGERTALQPQHPVDVAPSLGVPVLGLYGEADTGIPAAQVATFRSRLSKEALARGTEIVVYPEAPHAFFADYRPSYRAEAAADAWRRTLLWLEARTRIAPSP